MLYYSTRGLAEPVDFIQACLSGLAPDGGLYVPEAWPSITPARPGESYVSVATRILSAFAGDSISSDIIEDLCTKAYGNFAHQSVAPLVQTGPDQFIMELHHGPTLAFKDIAMQIIAQLYEHVLSERGQRLSVICATSGDTGGAAAAAFAGKKTVDLFILHPHLRVSPVQRLFMTTTGADNIHNFSLDSDFDTCQAIVKAMFADKPFAESIALSGVNSINWARIAAQSVYFATAQAALGPERPIRFIVPSGNMGDALAGYVAGKCGLLVDFDGICAVNENKTLETVFNTGEMSKRNAVETPSPAMDISVPSNFERLLFEVSGRDPEIVRSVYNQYLQSGHAALPEAAFAALKKSGLSSFAVSNSNTCQEMRDHLSETGALICPHTAVGTKINRQAGGDDRTRVVLSTAHAAKFPETVEEATGEIIGLPGRCQTLRDRGEVFDQVSPEFSAVKAAIQAKLGLASA